MEPIAIVGIGCRFPGDSAGPDDIDTPSAFWDFLQRRGDAYTDFPADRLNIDGWYHPEQGRPGSFYTRGGCFLKQDPRLFDPSMFGISPQETRTLDPAQRKLLETVYEAFESSGTPLHKINGSSTGCFIGNFNYDHQLMQFRDAEFPEPYAMTGGGIALLSNRISYIFDLHGPSLTLDTACSSSMYALHLACSAIESGECTAAVVGGSNLILTPECQTFSAALGAVSRTSKCNTFDAAADGYARAEGVGVLYIKKLDQAVKDGDPIRAVIRATAINANGRTGGITHPDPSGQERAIRRAYQRAGNLSPAATSYFECHGTGTAVGDPLEVEAVGKVFAADRTAQQPLYIGSVKSNMGHCEAASGIAGVIKAVLAIENKVIPPIRELNNVNPNVDLHDGRLHIVQENIPWPECTVRRASVNSFGYGGANAHTILEEADYLAPGRGALTARFASYARDYKEWTFDSSMGTISPASPVSISPTDSLMTSSAPNGKLFETAFARSKLASQRCFLLPVSAHNEQTLRRNIDALLPRIDQWNISDLAYTLGCRRSVFATRSYVVATRDQAQKVTLEPENFAVQRARPSQNSRLGFVFTGQGAQWPEMGKELMDTFHVYLESIRRLDRVLAQLPERPEWSIEQALQAAPDVSRVYEAALSQPLVTAVQIALVDLLSSWSILPTASVGHSSGEIAAAYAAGQISSAEAIVIAYARGRAVQKNKRTGAMLAVSTNVESMKTHLAQYPTVNIACHNSPESLTLSGDVEAINAVKALLDSQGTFTRLLHTGGNAYHSHHMKTLGEDYEVELRRMLDHLHPKQRLRLQPISTFVSSVTDSISADQSPKTAYWRQNLESPVLFNQAVQTMLRSCPVNIFIEVGPHAVLRGPIRQITKSMKDITATEYLPTVLRSEDGARSVLETAGMLWSKGFNLDFKAVNSAYRTDEHYGNRVIVDLPKYQWQYGDINYSENRWTREFRLKTHPYHDILGSRQHGGNHNEPMWRNIISTQRLPWLKDHQIGSDVVFPAAGYLSMAVEAALQMTELKGTPRAHIKTCTLERLTINSALTIPDAKSGVEILLNLRRSRLDENSYSDSKYEFTVTSVSQFDSKDVFTEHAHGSVAACTDVPASQGLPEQYSVERPISISRWYDAFSRVGLNYGPSFRCMSDISASRNQHRSGCVIATDSTKDLKKGESEYSLHPTALDAAIQLAIIAAHRGRSTDCDAAFIPVSVAKVSFSMGNPASATAMAWAKSSFLESGNVMADICIKDVDGRALVSFDGFELVRAASVAPPSVQLVAHPFTRLVWKPDIDSLTTDKCKDLFASPTEVETTDEPCPPMDTLALYLLVRLHSLHPTIFTGTLEDVSLVRFQTWMNEKLAQARAGTIIGGPDAFSQTDSQRADTIATLLQEISPAHGPEARFMYHMFENYPRVFSGEISGIQAAVQTNLLSEMYEHMELYEGGSKVLGDVLSLISHKKPDLDIFEIGAGTGSASREILQRLRGRSDFRGYSSYTFTDITPSFLAAAQDAFQRYSSVQYSAFDMEKPTDEQGFDRAYDVVVASNVIHVTADMQRTLTNIRRLIKPGGKLVLFEIVRSTMAWITLLGTFPGFWKGDSDPGCPRTEGPFLTMQMWADVLPRCGFSGIDLSLDHFAQHKDAAVILSTATEDSSISRSLPHSDAVIIVYRDTPSSFCLDFQHFIQASGLQAELVPLHAVQNLYGRHVVSLAEVERSLFVDCPEKEWTGAQEVLLYSASAVWVTGGGLIDSTRPEAALVSGLVSAIHAENGGSRTLTLDLDFGDTNTKRHFQNILLLLNKAVEYKPGDDFGYRTKQGILHTSRLVDDETLNRSDDTESAEAKPLESIPAEPVIEVKDSSPPSSELLADDEIEISIQARGNVTHESLPSEIGKASNCLVYEVSGIVNSVGALVTTFKPGDLVYGLCSYSDNGKARTSAQFCHQMQQGQSFREAVSSITASCISLYGIESAARLTSGETIFVHANDFHVRLTACSYALDTGASVFTVVSSEEEKISTLELIQALPPDHIWIEAAHKVSEDIHRYTQDQGVDVVLSDASDELSEAHWQLLAPLGRYVRFSTTTINQNANLAASDPSKCASYTSFSLDQISRIRPVLIHRLLEKTDALRKAGKIPIPVIESVQPESIPAGKPHVDLNDDYDSTANTIVATINQPRSDDENSEPVSDPGTLHFDPEASYLLVGCLGGLGRSFSDWIVSRGAKKLVYLARSGTSNSEVADYVARLRSDGISVQVVQGDVSFLGDVQRAVAATGGSLRGIVQAPLTLNDSLLHSMTLREFNATMRPRVIGTLNLHHATQDLDLDFFMMWSSWTEVLGSASQANYSASSAFMDALAQHRQRRGLAATSLSLGHMLDIGIVSDHLDYQEHLMQMGLYGNGERDFLHFCETAISRPGRGHLLAGLEPAGLAANRARHPLESMHWFRDPRFAGLLRATERLTLLPLPNGSADLSSAGGGPQDPRTIALSDDDPSEPLPVRVRKRVARCLFLALDDVEPSVPVTNYGIDSMVAAQIRNWLVTALGANVSLFTLLHPTLTVERLVTEVERCLDAGKGGKEGEEAGE